MRYWFIYGMEFLERYFVAGLSWLGDCFWRGNGGNWISGKGRGCKNKS